MSEEELSTLPRETRLLELGCGQIKRWPYSVSVDFNPRSLADVIHDLNVFPYPFADNEFDIVIAEHVLEHLGNLVKIVEELHRIIKPGGSLYVEVPHFSSGNFFTDITHTHAFSTRSFDYFCPGTKLAEFRYSEVQFVKKEVTLCGYDTRLRRMLSNWINRHQDGYERKLAFIIPSANINFHLEVLK